MTTRAGKKRYYCFWSFRFIFTCFCASTLLIWDFGFGSQQIFFSRKWKEKKKLVRTCRRLRTRRACRDWRRWGERLVRHREQRVHEPSWSIHFASWRKSLGGCSCLQFASALSSCAPFLIQFRPRFTKFYFWKDDRVGE